jgi:hypothetical protein
MYRTLVVKNRFPSRLATDEGEKMLSGLLHVVIGGGAIAFVGGLVAQVDPNGQAGTTGYWVAASGIATAMAAAMGTIVKGFLDYKEKEEAAKITRLRITLGNDRLRHYHVETREYLEKLARYLASIPGAPPGIPEPPSTPDPIPHHVKPEPDDD